MRTIVQRPDASAILGSLRAIGYSFDTAIADIVDNSISADATSVSIDLDICRSLPVLSISDDGAGMTSKALIDAMRHGGTGVTRIRDKNDLGRYGLGLKTASLSQCRRLTVASLAAHQPLAGARWDLTEVELRNEWTLQLPSRNDLRNYVSVQRLIRHGRGTVVIWEDFDLAISGSTDAGKTVAVLLDDARQHLSLIFQRFLEAEDEGSAVKIAINSTLISGVDPFLRSNPKTQELPTEEVKVEGSRVRITPFILPQLKNISATELASLGGALALRRGQGFYVYRNNRLIIAGTWFRIIKLDELTKLARVRVDIPNTMDGLWNLDVKKSSATPPESVRRVLKRIIERIASRSLIPFRERAVQGNAKPYIPVWNRKQSSAGVSYLINREHPMIANYIEGAIRTLGTSAERALQLIEVSVPYAMIVADVTGEANLGLSANAREIELSGILKEWLDRCGGDDEVKAELVRAIPSLEPFASNPEITRALLKTLL